MIKSDLNNAREVCELLYELTRDEGDSVEIHHGNEGYLNYERAVRMRRHNSHVTLYLGNSLLECLRAAKGDEGR